ncbi:MAG: Aminomethyltransferase [Verrucomicrobia subdivision 3 bacterium]|nr:Aminomethyltransferase [Limisphaerales bacterium]MCS1414626.1 Aminomethyltransferase [Limisphaerales bacterium]
MISEENQQATPNVGKLNGSELILDYGSPQMEWEHLRTRVGVLELSSRGRVCLLGEDRHRFLNGQVTNNVRDLADATGCYTLITNNKGIIWGDANVYRLPEELLLDLEPGFTKQFSDHLEKYIVADDVEIVDTSPHFGLISIQGPLADELLGTLEPDSLDQRPAKPYNIMQRTSEELGDYYIANHPRIRSKGYDIFVPHDSLPELQRRLLAQVLPLGGGLCGWSSLETLRIEMGIPRFPIDMTPSILAPELGLEERMISYSKGCYIGQEVINRIRSIGRVNRHLVGIIFDSESGDILGTSGTIQNQQKSAGFVTSTAFSHALGRTIGLGFVKRGHSQSGTSLEFHPNEQDKSYEVAVSDLPFYPPR